MAIRTYKAFAEAQTDTGAYWESWFHKTSAPTPGSAGGWGDLSVGSGTPKYNAYVGTQLEATPLINSNNSAIYCGPTPASGQTKHLTEVSIQSTNGTNNVPLTFMLCDYLMFYPLVDCDSTDQQDMDNTETLPRYENGTGVRALLVVAAPMASTSTATMVYTSCDGSTRSTTFGIINSANLGAIVQTGSSSTSANARANFIPLADGCKGIRNVQSFTLSAPAGGFVNLVLVKPLASTIVREASTWTEKTTFITQAGNAPRIYDGAFLNFIFQTSGTSNPATVRGKLGFTWG